MKDRERILKIAEDKFFGNGFYKTTMDELAKELSMSKKTIYKNFHSKNELVRTAVMRFLENEEDIIFKIVNSNKNAIEKFVELNICLNKDFAKLSTQLLNDLRKHLPGLWDEVEEFRAKRINKNLFDIIEQGKREELFSNFPTTIIMTIFLSSVKSVVNPQFIYDNNFSLNQATKATFQIMVNGILSEKGLEMFKAIKYNFNGSNNKHLVKRRAIYAHNLL